MIQQKVTAKYSKRMVIAHWLTLALLFVAWFIGDELNDARHEVTGAPLAGYVAHALVGAVILLLTLSRLYFRRKDGATIARIYEISGLVCQNLLVVNSLTTPVT